MKISCLNFLIFMILSQTTFTQVLPIQWQSCFGGSEPDFAVDIIEVDDGYLILANARSDDGDVSNLHGGQDGWLIKTDTFGNLIWEKALGGSFAEDFYRILDSNNGYYYLLSSSHSSNGDISNDPYLGSTDFWIIKIDSLGNIIWDKIVGGEILDQIWTGVVTNDGGIVAYGWTGSTTGEVSVSYGLYDIWMIKLNSDGEVEWDFSVGTSGFDFGQALIQTSDGGFLLGGACRIQDGGNLICEPHSEKAEAVLVKLDSNLNIEWQRCYGGTEDEGVTGLLELNDGYIFTAYAGSNDGDLVDSGWHGSDDIWVVRVDLFGNIIWQKCLGGSLYEFAKNLFISEDNGIFVIGHTESHNGDVVGNHTQSEYDSDIWMVKLSNDGELEWQQCIGGIGHEAVDFGVLRKSDIHFVLAGQFDEGPSFDVECTPFGFYADMPDVWVLEIKDTTTTVGIMKSINSKLSVYPNPAKDYVVFELNDNLLNPNQPDNIEISMFNFYGQKLKNLTLYTSGNKFILDISDINGGVYMYSFIANNITYTDKIVIQK